MQKITPFLWFHNQAEQAAKFYVSIFNHSKIGNIARYGAAAAKVSGKSKGTVMTVAFDLGGQKFTALNGGPLFKFTEAISFVVNCQTQKEVDALWAKLSKGGEKGRCGWLKDKYGVSWQIVPIGLDKLISGPDAVKSERVMAALLKMDKLDIKILRQAYAGLGLRQAKNVLHNMGL